MSHRVRIAIIVSFLISLSSSLGARPATDDPVELLKNAIPRGLLPANYRNEQKPGTTRSGDRLENVSLRFNGPDNAFIEFELKLYDNLTKPISTICELETRYLPDVEILARNLGIGDASVHFQRRAAFLAPFDIRSQTVRAYWGTCRLEVAVRDYQPVGRAPHFSHDQAAQLARQLAKATSENIRTGRREEDEAPPIITDEPAEQPPPPAISQADWERMRGEVARLAPYANDEYAGELLKEGYIGVIVGAYGDVQVYDHNGKRREGKTDQFIRIGDTIRTGKNGLARIQFIDRNDAEDKGPSVINGAPNTEWVFDKFAFETKLTREERNSVLTLITGTIKAFFEGWGKNSAVSIRTGVTICGIRGSEVLVSYDPRAEKVNAYVIEGHMDVTNTATGQTVPLTDNQKLVVDSGNIGAIQPMNRAEWDSLLKRHGMKSEKPAKPPRPVKPAPPVPPVPAEAYAIPEIQATITEVMFYEADFGNVPPGQRVYRKLFARDATRFVNWELRLTHPAPEQRTEFAVEAVWTAPDGSEFARHTYKAPVDAGRTTSIHSWGRGWKEPGNWKPGTYTVLFFSEGREIAAGSFKVYEQNTL